MQVFDTSTNTYAKMDLLNEGFCRVKYQNNSVRTVNTMEPTK